MLLIHDIKKKEEERNKIQSEIDKFLSNKKNKIQRIPTSASSENVKDKKPNFNPSLFDPN